MPRRKRHLPHKKERCLLSDVLPYEIPVSFSNRHFYSFILKHRIELCENSIHWVKGSAALDRIVHLLFSLPENSDRLSDVPKYVGEKTQIFRAYCLKGKSDPKPPHFLTPFGYNISHKEAEFRELCVPHPRSQLQVSDFYDRCKELILYYTSLSKFSIRAPSSVAKFIFHNDRLHKERLSTDIAEVEEDGKEYENLRSFFVYREYSNIYKFYESYRYHRAEKKYNRLVKLDVSKCFDSIYTHSIAWATIGKDALKEALSQSASSFPDKFDKLMNRMNMGETNGIIIGPEFSRIFAEIILQAIDREVQHKLESGPLNLRHQTDYEIYRYVDDYFIFYNTDEARSVILDELQHALKRYKLYLNAAKAVTYEKPIITEITMAKHQIASLLEEKIRFSQSDVFDEDGEKVAVKGSVYVNANALITAFKTIIKTCNVQYKDMLNYSLSIVERKCLLLIKKYLEVSTEHRSPKQMANAIENVLEFVFFIYAVSPRVNTTIRLCRIIELLNGFMNADTLGKHQIQVIKKKIYDDVCFILKKNKSAYHTQVETLYLLIALAELGKDYWLDQEVLAEYLGISIMKKGPVLGASRSLNYFAISVSLLYMREKKRYSVLRDFIINLSLKRIRDRSETCEKDTELVLLLFDLIACPYVPTVKKKQALSFFNVTDELASEIIEYRDVVGSAQCWFTNWQDFDFAKELDAKRSREVY